MSRFLTDIMSKKAPDGERPASSGSHRSESASEYPEPKTDFNSMSSTTPTSTPTITTPTSSTTTTPTITTPTNTSNSRRGSTGRSDKQSTEAGQKKSSTSVAPIAPQNNFQKVTNTITQQAIPQRLFRTGKTKEIYDVLYGLTRGAITPRRAVVISKPNLRKLTGVGSRITIDACLGYLEIVGLVSVQKNLSGQHEGNTYEIFTPEEIGRRYTEDEEVVVTGTSMGSSTPGSPAQTLGVLPRLVTTRGSTGSELGIIEASDPPKTLLKTDTTDDEAFAAFIRTMQTAAEEVIGRKLRRQDGENLEKLAELLVLELKIAASRAGTISSVPAFLTEHLQRRLFTARRNEQQQQGSSSTKTTKTKPDVVGKAEAETFEIKPLDEQARETALAELAEFAEEDFLADFAKWYTTDDWQWLNERLSKKK